MADIGHRTSDPARIRLLVFDVDGVFTDGVLHYHDDGTVARTFDIRDGFGVRAAREAGLVTGVLTAKVSSATRRRMEDLKIDYFFEGYNEAGGKGGGVEELADQAGVPLEAAAYMGDDVMDLPALKRVGYPMCPADACGEVRAAAAFVSENPGGRGAVRDAVEHILKAQGKWDELVQRFMGTGG